LLASSASLAPATLVVEEVEGVVVFRGASPPAVDAGEGASLETLASSTGAAEDGL
jgi:hypothetical protein